MARPGHADPAATALDAVGSGWPGSTGATWPGRPTGPWTGPRGEIGDGEADPSSGRRRHHLASRWMGWRLRLLVVCALVGCIGLFALVRAVVDAPWLDAVWGDDGSGRIELLATHDPALAPFVGRALKGAIVDGATLLPDESLAERRAERWVIDDHERARRLASARTWRLALDAGDARLVFDDGGQATLRPSVRPFASLPIAFWLLLGFAFALYLAATTVVLAHPCVQNLAFLAMALAQSANLLLVAIGRALPLGLSADSLHWTPTLQFALDWLSVAAMVHAAALHPRRAPRATLIAGAAWFVAAASTALLLAGRLPYVWWWAQVSITTLGALTVALYGRSYRIEAHPFAFALRRFGLLMLSTWALLTGAVVAADRIDALHEVATTGPVTWYLFLASLLLLVPFLARSQDFLREFSLLAAISTVATSLDLLFVMVFSLGQVTSLALALFASLAVYTGVRQWVINRLVGEHLMTTERMFEQLYRTAREVELRPERTPALLSELLAGLFDPLEIGPVAQRPGRVRIGGGGSSLHVPVPLLGGETDVTTGLVLDEPASAPGSLVLRYARRGRRLFTDDDARLAGRIVEQLRRAVRFDRAVEQGRSEERLRLAQDLHDDIGARLLTLLYQAPSPEMGDYVRHTLQDLKTLTRGLADTNHRLSHAAVEWKADIGQRVQAAGMTLQWHAVFDEDILLSVVQWSALTRILRELVSNAIAHSQANRIEIEFRLEHDAVALRVVDDGTGREPRVWSHGLGLGGVRKRVKQLGGSVEWREAEPRGIECRVRIGQFSTR